MVPGALGAATITRQQSLLPYPYYQSIIVTNPPIGNFISHQGVLSVQKRLSHGLVILLAYTKGKSIDDGISSENQNTDGDPGTGTGWQNRGFDKAAERGLDGEDVSQRLVISGVYELPFQTGKEIPNWRRLRQQNYWWLAGEFRGYVSDRCADRHQWRQQRLGNTAEFNRSERSAFQSDRRGVV